MMSLKEYSDPNQKCLSDYLPWACLVGPGIIQNKDGSLQKSFVFRGHDLDGATARELMSASAHFNNAMRRLGDGWAVFIEAQRNPVKDYPANNWSHAAAKIIDDERKNIFSRAGVYFKNDYFMTFSFKEPTRLAEKSDKWFVKKSASNRDEEQDKNKFQKAINEISGLFNGVFPVFRELDDEETLSYLHSTLSTRRHRIACPDVPMYLDHILADEDIEHGLELRLGDNYVRTVTIRGFPSESFPGILDAINDLDFSFRWSTRFIFMGQEVGRSHLENMRRVWYAGRKRITTVLKEIASQSESGLAESSSLKRSGDADAAIQLLEEGIVSFGFFTATISVWDQDQDKAEERVNKVMSAVNRMGFACHLETMNAFEAWLSSIPGQCHANIRRPVVHTLNLAHMVPMSSIWAGEESNTHLKAPPHFFALCRGSTPFRFSCNVGDVGHTLIFGPTGAGKSTLLSFMAAQWLRYNNAQVFMFDKGYSSRVLTECMGGSFFTVGAKSDELCFQPLKNIDQEAERIWAAEWLAELVAEQKLTVTAETRIEIWQALLSLAEQPFSSRTLSIFKSLVQDEGIRKALQPFTLLGAFGHLFDANDEKDSADFWQVFEMAELFEQKAAVKPALSYLFHRLSKKFDGRPTLLILDEAWLLLEDSQFARQIKQWLKELRKSNVYVVFATQSIADAMQSSIAMTLKECCPTKIFLPNASAQDESSAAFYQSMGLNERQIEIIASAIPKREYYLSSSSGNRLFDLALGPRALALCASSSPDEQRRLIEIKRQHGSDEVLNKFLEKRGLLHEINDKGDSFIGSSV
jgi:type IV secretion/conjugal transfer VirB4 family ATPase